jgi:hypothetical protein
MERSDEKSSSIASPSAFYDLIVLSNIVHLRRPTSLTSSSNYPAAVRLVSKHWNETTLTNRFKSIFRQTMRDRLETEPQLPTILGRLFADTGSPVFLSQLSALPMYVCTSPDVRQQHLFWARHCPPQVFTSRSVTEQSLSSRPALNDAREAYE